VPWPSTRIAGLLGIELPIVLSPMAGSWTPELVAAVSNAGGLGSIGGAYTPPDELRAAIRRVRELTDRPFAVNLFAWSEPTAPAHEAVRAVVERLSPTLDELGLDEPELEPPPSFARLLEAQLAVVAEERVPVFSFHLGIPPLDAVRESVVIGTATTVAEAVALEEAGVDAIVAQGSEAGGHRGTFAGPVDQGLVGLVALVPQLVDRVGVPVLAAGGIMDGRGIVAALALGADGAQLGTAFLTSPESGAPEPYRDVVAAAADDSTTVTPAFTGRHARAVRTPLSEALEAAGQLPFPLQAVLLRPLYAAAAAAGRHDLMFVLAGQAAALSRRLPAGELVATLARETDEALRTLAPQ
jgi:nitronate monooxygenase